jgi:hypothetical protein
VTCFSKSLILHLIIILDLVNIWLLWSRYKQQTGLLFLYILQTIIIQVPEGRYVSSNNHQWAAEPRRGDMFFKIINPPLNYHSWLG